MRIGAVVMNGVKDVEVRQFDVGDPGPDQVLVKVHRCLICTTDWETWLGLRGALGRRFPWGPGHEEAGEVLDVGEGVPPDIKVGDHVAIAPQEGCGVCWFCRRGFNRRCPNQKEDVREEVVGTFGMSQLIVVNARRIFRMNPSLPYEEAAYLEPVASSVHALRRTRITYEDDVLVIGAGNLGLVNAQVARGMGARVLVSEINPERCKIAESMGFATVNPLETDVTGFTKELTHGKGMDAAIVCVGNTKANDQAVQALSKYKGRLLFFAAAYPPSEIHVDPNAIHYRELELIGTSGADMVDCETAAELLNSGKVKVDRLLSHRVPLDEIGRAFELAATPGNYRVAIEMWPQAD